VHPWYRSAQPEVTLGQLAMEAGGARWPVLRRQRVTGNGTGGEEARCDRARWGRRPGVQFGSRRLGGGWPRSLARLGNGRPWWQLHSWPRAAAQHKGELRRGKERQVRELVHEAAGWRWSSAVAGHGATGAVPARPWRTEGEGRRGSEA
jgi:hypothetical protein